MAIGYAAAAFVIMQAASLILPVMPLPAWTYDLVVVLILGFPLAMILGWAFDITASGIERTRPAAGTGGKVAADAPDGLAPMRALPWVWIGAGAVMLVAGGFATAIAFRISADGSLLAAGVITEQERVLTADFENHTGDTSLGMAVTEAFRVDLSHSPLLRVVSSTDVQSALARMNRPADAPLVADLARELAEREGIKAVVTGEMYRVGTGYVLSAHLVSSLRGGILASFRETADDDRSLIPTIGRLSRDLRARAGESLRSLRGGEPLELVTTASLDALRRYSEAVRAYNVGDYAGSIPLLDDAVALDSGFAMAYRKLGVSPRFGRCRSRATAGRAAACVYASGPTYGDRAIPYDGGISNHRARRPGSRRLHLPGTAPAASR